MGLYTGYLGLFWGYTSVRLGCMKVILGSYLGHIGLIWAILRLYWDNGK